VNLLEPRRYRILSVIGEGAVGRVYRARLVRTDGFEKEIALKVLSEIAPARSVLERFRDEARLLALVRDRAVVGTGPPLRLDGRWAVPMDFVDGATCDGLLTLHQAFPAPAAAEVVAEVARALAQGWSQPGPDGEPLCVIHRDVKPANVLVTPSGEVRLLDYGIARARFASRESRTRGHVGGTPGYIAPERLFGLEGPASDIYALGVVLHELLVGERPSAGDATVPPGLASLVAEMLDDDPEARPPAREVERRCRSALRELPGPSLREWAESDVAPPPPLEPDELVGRLLEEDVEHSPVMIPVHAGGEPQLWGLILPVLAMLLLAVGVMLGSATSVAPAPARSPSPVQNRAPVVAPTPSPLPPAATVPAAEPFRETPVQRPPPVPAAPVQSETAPAGRPMLPVRVTSIPMGATVRLGDELIGVTPLTLDLSWGDHVMRLDLAGRGSDRRLVVGRRSPTRYVWHVEEDRWVSGY
jgi:serine/threonine protein kinase